MELSVHWTVPTMLLDAHITPCFVAWTVLGNSSPIAAWMINITSKLILVTVPCEIHCTQPIAWGSSERRTQHKARPSASGSHPDLRSARDLQYFNWFIATHNYKHYCWCYICRGENNTLFMEIKPLLGIFIYTSSNIIMMFSTEKMKQCVSVHIRYHSRLTSEPRPLYMVGLNFACHSKGGRG